jgi:hypothetical protein
MAKNNSNQGGPTHRPKDEPTADRSEHHASSRDELKDRAAKDSGPGQGRRNGSSKQG